MVQFCNQSRSQRHSPFLPSGRKFQVIFNRNFHSKKLFPFEMKSTDSTWAIPQLINCPMALYGAIETLHDIEQNRTHPSRNILRDRLLKVNETKSFLISVSLLPIHLNETKSSLISVSLLPIHLNETKSFLISVSLLPIHLNESKSSLI